MSSLTVKELTARGRGGVSVLRVEGAAAGESLERLLGGRALPRIGTFAVVRLASGEELLDEGLLLRGDDDRFELHLHGSPPVVERVLAELGGRSSGPEPETIEEEAQRALAEARCEAAARVLLDQAQGALRRALENLDPAEVEPFRRQVAELVERGRWGVFLARQARVVLAGPVNAGKSTLFNLLVDRERVVVSSEEGTTRDAVIEHATLGAWPVELVDTAGSRELRGELASTGAGRVERAGQDLGRSLRRSADLVLELRPATLAGRTESREEDGQARVAHLTTRTDEVRGGAGIEDPDSARISALEDPAGARRTVEHCFHTVLGLPREPWVPGRAVPFTREQLSLLQEALASDPKRARERIETLLGDR